MTTSFLDGDILPSALRQREVCRARAIDVEDLLQWAIVSQLPRGSAVSATTWGRIDYWRRVREDEEKRRKRLLPIWEKPERSSRLCALARNHARACDYSVSAHMDVATGGVWGRSNSLGYLAGTPHDDAIA